MSAGGLPYHDRVSSIEEKLRGLDVFILAAMQAFQIDSVELYNDRSITLQKEYSAGCQSAADLISILSAGATYIAICDSVKRINPRPGCGRAIRCLPLNISTITGARIICAVASTFAKFSSSSLGWATEIGTRHGFYLSQSS